MLRLELLQNPISSYSQLTELYPQFIEFRPQPISVFGLGSYFNYTNPENRKMIHDIDIGGYWSNGLQAFSSSLNVYMEREGGRFKVLELPASEKRLLLHVIYYDEVCLDNAIINSPDSSPEARKSLYSGVLRENPLKGWRIIIKKIMNKVGPNYEDIFAERYIGLQLSDLDEFKETEPLKAWKVMKRLSDIYEKRNIKGVETIVLELNGLRDELNNVESPQSLFDKLQELRRELLELTVKHYKKDGLDLV